MDKQQLQQMVDNAMESLNDAERATPAPFLLTRINARMKNSSGSVSFWEKVLTLVTKPTVAFPALALVCALNFWLFRESNAEADALATEYKMVTNDDYSLSTATSLFDIENLP